MSLSQMQLPFGIKLSETGVDRYRCEICLMDIQGYRTLDPHCRGKNHEKRMLNFCVKGHYFPTVEGKIPDRLQKQIDLPMDLVWNGIVRMSVMDHYWCEVCARPVCGITPARQHYEGDHHRKKLMKNNGSLCLPPNVERQLDILATMDGPVFPRDPERVPKGIEDCFCRVCGVLRFGRPAQVCEEHMQRMEYLSRNFPKRG